jgi:hypothetical protein
VPKQRRERGWPHLVTGDSVRGMSEDFAKDELLEVPHIARYLQVSDVTVYRWCREGGYPDPEKNILFNERSLLASPLFCASSLSVSA